jgi:predicted LPLAT superfamily acyltransferase
MTKNHWVVTNNAYLEMIQGVKILASCIKRPFQALIITKQSVLLRNHQKLSMHKETISKELGLSRFQKKYNTQNLKTQI